MQGLSLSEVRGGGGKGLQLKHILSWTAGHHSLHTSTLKEGVISTAIVTRLGLFSGSFISGHRV